MSKPVYLDYAATTPVDPAVAAKMSECLTLDGNFANPASRSHKYGWRAEEGVEAARRQVADVIAADPRTIVWTSGATEANNLAIKGIAAGADKSAHFVTSAIEHKAVLDCFEWLAGQGYAVTYLQPDNQGRIALERVTEALRPETALVSMMYVNNEIGVINDIPAIGQLCRERGITFHVDAAQAVGKLAIDVETSKIDMMSMCAHKIYGPKGIGALYVRRTPPLTVTAQIHGGGHERGMRSGTLPTHQCIGMGEALRLASEQLVSDHEHNQALMNRFIAQVTANPEVSVNADQADKVPNIRNLCFAGFDGDRLMMVLRNLAVSSGSACTSASIEPSFVLKAIGLDDQAAHSSLRFSVGRFTTEDDIDQAIAAVNHGLEKLRQLPS